MDIATVEHRYSGNASFTAAAETDPLADHRGIFQEWRRRASSFGIDAEIVLTAALLAAAAIIAVLTASDYALTVDEYNTDGYGPKALAWYTSGFVDRSHFEKVEFSLWYYGPWFHMLTAFVQSFDLADRFTVRHAMTFLVGLAGLAALLPIGRLAIGRWAGLTAIALCLLTGYLYGSLFFTPIDVPFLAAMTWATLAIMVMTRQVLPSWPATIAAGLLTGLALGTRTGGIITHAYLLGALVLCAFEAAGHGRLTPRYLAQLSARFAAVVVLAWLTAIAIWPWLQIGNPLAQFKIALVHFATIPMSFEFSHWGERIMTNALPWSYIPAQLLVRLPEAFLLLLAVAGVGAIVVATRLLRDTAGEWRLAGSAAALRAAALGLARGRGMLIVTAAVVLPLGFLIVQRATIYDGVRHVLFVIPMLAVVAGAGLVALLPLLRRAPMISAIAGGAYVGSVIWTLAVLHPLEYIALNALVGGVRGGYDRFETDYWAAGATVALRRLEQRLDHDPVFGPSGTRPRILICIMWREWLVAPILRRPWIVETDGDKADFIIESHRWRCAKDKPVVLIDEVKRFDRSFAWIYARRLAP
jgi:hypothetical protein